jgi:mono/diheme cytochrome c family protein
MKKITHVTSGILMAIIVSASCGPSQKEQGPVSDVSNDSLIRRGAYLVNVMGCHDCHSPKKMTAQGPALDMDRLLSGHPADMPLFKFDTATTKNWVLFNMMNTAAVGPWGASFSANLTSDTSGIGAWTETQFKKALTEGKLKGLDGTRPILPPMPWQNYKDLRDEDVKAIFAYLKSTKPVKNVVPAPIAPQDLAKVTK